MFTLFKKILMLILVMLALISCSEKSQQATIRIGMNVWPGYELIYLAKEQGFFQQHGLNVEVLEYTSLTDVKTAFERGHIDVMCATLIEMLQSYEQTKIDSKLILLTDYSNGSDMIISHSDIATIPQLKGKKVGVEMSSLGVYILSRALQLNQVLLSDVSLVPLDQTKMEEQLHNKEIDAAVTYPPFVPQIKQSMSVNTLFSSADIPYEVVDVVVMNKQVFDTNPGIKMQFRVVWQQALDYLKQHRQAAIRLMAERENVSVEAFEQAMAGIVLINIEAQQTLFAAPRKLLKTIENINQVSANGWVRIKANCHNDWCRITVMDSGQGLTDVQQRSIFQPFSRLEKHRNIIQGTGIGLSITKNLVTMMKGRVGVDSQDGQGSSFWLELPGSKKTKTMKLNAPGEKQRDLVWVQNEQCANFSILCVEDNPENMRFFISALESIGRFQVCTANTAMLGLELAMKHKPDLILLDICLPEMDGFQMLAEIKAISEFMSIPVIAMTANASSYDLKKGLAAGFYDYLIKPIKLATLKRVIEKALPNLT